MGTTTPPNPKTYWLPTRYQTACGPAMPTFDPSASLGELLWYIREQHALSFNRMAELANMDNSTVVRMANGKFKPSYILLRALVEVLPIPRWEQDALLASAGYLPLSVRQGWRPVLDQVASALNLLATHPARLARYEQLLLAWSEQAVCMERNR